MKTMVVLKGLREGRTAARTLLHSGPTSVLCGLYETSPQMTLNRIRTALASRCSPIIVDGISEQALLNKFAEIAKTAGYSVLELDSTVR